jgi:hypothetical protein
LVLEELVLLVRKAQMVEILCLVQLHRLVVVVAE